MQFIVTKPHWVQVVAKSIEGIARMSMSSLDHPGIDAAVVTDVGWPQIVAI